MLKSFLKKNKIHILFTVSDSFFRLHSMFALLSASEALSQSLGAKKVSLTACHLGKLYLACTSLKVVLASLKKN